VGFVVDKAAMGQCFSGYFGFSCQLFVAPIAPQSSSSSSSFIQGWYNMTIRGLSNSELCSTPAQLINNKNCFKLLSLFELFGHKDEGGKFFQNVE
jgi:hypothetical protein